MRLFAVVVLVVMTGGIADACPARIDAAGDGAWIITACGAFLGWTIALACFIGQGWTPEIADVHPTSADVVHRITERARRFARNWLAIGVTLLVIALGSDAVRNLAGGLAGLSIAALPMWWRAARLSRLVDAPDAVCLLGDDRVIVKCGNTARWLYVSRHVIARCTAPAIPSAQITRS
jgi:hypothetical protein